jgi:hypothetical protein
VLRLHQAEPLVGRSGLEPRPQQSPR